jgi:glycosyltransferase involved in cell wall biosynthesis
MRILVVQESDWLDRGPLQSHHLMERLSKRGHQILVIDTDIRTKIVEKNIISKRTIFEHVHKVIDDGDITVIRPSILRIPILDYISLVWTHTWEIKKQIEEFKPDIIIGFGILNANIAVNLAKKNNIPFIYYIIDELHRLVPQKYFQILAKFIESKNMEESDKVISINEALRDYTIMMGADTSKTSVIRAGVDLERFSSADGTAIRERYGICKDNINLFFMGLFYGFSGLKEVAMELTKQENRKIKLILVGKGDLWDELQDIRNKYKLEERMTIVGWCPYEEVPNHIAASDICILPAYKNDIMMNIVPIKMYEYMAAGKPVIATKLPGLMTEFGDGHGVIYVDESKDILMKALELNKGGELRRHGLKAQDFVENNGWNNIVDVFEGILGELT